MKSTSMVRIVCSLGVAGGLLMSVACGSDESAKKPDKPVKQEVKKPPTKEEAVAALIGDAKKLMARADYAAAKGKYEAALQKDPGNFDARFGVAQAQVGLKDTANAEAALVELRKEKPDHKGVLFALGDLYSITEQHKKAIELFQEQLKSDEYNTEMLNRLIVAYRLSGDFPKAEENITKLLSRDPDNGDALKNLSLIYYDQGKFALSETIAINSLKLDDKDAALYNNRGMIRVKKGRYPEAMSFFRKSVELDPNLIAPHLNIGAIALRYRDYDTAAKHYGDAVKLDSGHPAANLGLGLALSGQEKGDEAVTQLERALKLDPKANVAMAELARVYKHQKNELQPAKDWAEKYIAAEGSVADDHPIKVLLSNIEIELEQERMLKETQAEAANAAANAPTEGAAPAEGAPAEGTPPAS